MYNEDWIYNIHTPYASSESIITYSKDERIDMRVFCKYDQQLDYFLKSIVQSVLVSYGNQLSLDGLGEIELIEDLPGFSDGRTIQGGKKIVLASRLFHGLPTYEISKLSNN